MAWRLRRHACALPQPGLGSAPIAPPRRWRSRPTSRDARRCFRESPDLRTVSARPMSELATGRTLLHYQVEGELGQGGMGEVYRARDLSLDRWVALKLLPAWAARDAEARRRFLSEARLASSLQH